MQRSNGANVPARRTPRPGTSPAGCRLMSLRARLLLLVILAVIPAIWIEIYGETQLRATRQQEIRQEASRLMRLAAAEQQRINEGARQLLVAFSAGQSV